MRKPMKSLALVLTLVLALAAFSPMALAAVGDKYPGVAGGSFDSSALGTVNIGTHSRNVAAGTGTQNVAITYNSGYYTSSTLPLSATITFTVLGYNKATSSSLGAINNASITGISTNNIAASFAPGTSTLTVTYNPRLQGTTSFSFDLSCSDVGYEPTTITFSFSYGSATYNPYYDQLLYNSYSIALDKPATMYAGDVYTLKAILTGPGGTVYNYNNNPYYDYNYLGNELYVYYDHSVAGGYYPFSTTRYQVYAGGTWNTPITSTTYYTLAELRAMGYSPKVYWSALTGYGQNGYLYGSSQNPNIKVTFSTDASSGLVKVGQVTDQSANFQALQPGTYNLTLSIPTGYALTNGDTSGNYSGMYMLSPNGYMYDPSNPYFMNYAAYASTKKTFQITVLPNPNASANTNTTGTTTPTTPIAGGVLPKGSKIGEILKDNLTVTNASGGSVATISMGSVVVLNTVGNKYEIAYAGGTGFVPKSLVNLTSTTLPEDGVVKTVSGACSVLKTASSSAKKLSDIKSGTGVIVFSTTGSWSYVYVDGNFGYIQSSYAAR